jgi:hypothetical protein
MLHPPKPTVHVSARRAPVDCLQRKLGDEQAMSDAIRAYLASLMTGVTSFDAVATLPEASAPTNVAVALTASDVAANK